MPTITFEPPATTTQWKAMRAMFGVYQPRWVIDTDNHDEHETLVVASVTTDSWPCDVTVYPGSQCGWARAVYEAGKRDAGKEFGAFRKIGKTMWFPETETGDVTQQPVEKPVRICLGTLESPPGDDDPGWVHAYIANTPPPNFIVNGVEYRPVTPPTAPPRCH